MTRSMVHVVLALCLLAAAVQRARTQGEPERDVRVCEIDSEDQPVKSALCIASNDRSYSHTHSFLYGAVKLPKLKAPVFVTYEMRPSDASVGNLQDGTHMYRGTSDDSEGWFVNEAGQFRHVVIDPVDDEAVLVQMSNPFNNGTVRVPGAWPGQTRPARSATTAICPSC